MAAGLRALPLALLLGMSQIAVAESLPDPTRPSIDLNNAGGGATAVPADSVPRGLQSVIISPQYHAAIINGEMVKLGGKIGDSSLVEVRENSVVLENAHGRRVMEMFPKVDIRKSETMKQDNSTQQKASGPTAVPEQAGGGIK